MTADGTYPVTRAGEIRTAAELDALPHGSVVQSSSLPKRASSGLGVKAPAYMRGWAWTNTGDDWWGPDNNRFSAAQADRMLAFLGPLTVLFRPDDPQPATGDDVEHRHACHDGNRDPECAECIAAAGAGEAEGAWNAVGGSLHIDREEAGVIVDALIAHREHASARKAVNSESTSDARADTCARLIDRINDATSTLAAQRGGEAEGRETLAQTEATNYARGHAESLGQDAALVGALARGFHDGFLAARGDAAPTVSAEQAWDEEMLR